VRGGGAGAERAAPRPGGPGPRGARHGAGTAGEGRPRGRGGPSDGGALARARRAQRSVVCARRDGAAGWRARAPEAFACGARGPLPAPPADADACAPACRDGGGLWQHAAGGGAARPRGLLSSGLRAAAGGAAARAYGSGAALSLLPPSARAAAAEAAAAARRRARDAADANREAWAALEARAAALFSGMSLTSAGQAVLAAFVPVTMAALLFPGRMRAYAYELPPGGPRPAAWTPPAAALAKGRGEGFAAPGALRRALWALSEELALAARGLYLLALFTPAILGAPLAFYFGVGREAWTGLLLWTLERAGVSAAGARTGRVPGCSGVAACAWPQHAPPLGTRANPARPSLTPSALPPTPLPCTRSPPSSSGRSG
jgi:hypothetical protein